MPNDVPSPSAGEGFIPGPPRTAWLDAAPTESLLTEPLLGPVPVRLARRALGIAALLGAIGQALFVDQAPGINLLILVAAGLAALAAMRSRGSKFDALDAWLPISALGFAGFVALRADPALLAFDTLAGLSLTAASVVALAGIPVTRRSVTDQVLLGLRGGAVAAGGAVRLSPGLQGTLGLRLGKVGRQVAAGAALAIPLVIVFGVLFAQADAIFGSLSAGLFDWRIDLGGLPVRVVVGAAVGWTAAGALALVIAATVTWRRDVALSLPRLGSVQGAVVLAAVDAVFAVFVALQAAYLFGGRDTLEISGLTYSQYARRGFFELVAVTVVAGGLILALEEVVRPRTRAYRALSLGLVGLTGVVLISAAARIGLYQQAYGWTELRFYVVAAICWLALCLVAAAIGILTRRSRWLPHAVAILGLVVALGVNIVGPQGFVATQNVARALDPGQIAPDGASGLDAEYVGGLGDGAVPVLVDALPRLDPRDRAIVVQALARRRADLDGAATIQGWPSWNLAREAARTELDAADLTVP